MASESPDRRRIFLSTLHARHADRRLAFGVILVSLVLFAVIAPHAKTKLPQVAAFMPAYEAALVVTDLVTAVLIFGQFNFTRSRAMLILAAGYLFTAFMTVAHALTFPGLFKPEGLLGAGTQSTAWLYMFWHGGFPLFVLLYAFDKDERRAGRLRRAPLSTVAAMTVAAVAAVAALLTQLTTQWHDMLPAIMLANDHAPGMRFVIGSVWLVSLCALASLYFRRPHSLLDLWLIVVMCAWLLDIALSALLNAGRWDVGFYAGRLYGLLASSFVLIVLLVHNSVLYLRLVHAYEGARRARSRVQETTRALTAANEELDAFSRTVSHDLSAPLRHVQGYVAMLEDDAAGELSERALRYLGVISDSTERMRRLITHLLDFARTSRTQMSESVLNTRALVDACISNMALDIGGRDITWKIGALPPVRGDEALLMQVWNNLLSNAVKYSRGRQPAVIEVSVTGAEGTRPVFMVRDNGVGFDMAQAGRLFGVFERLHGEKEFEGTGIGLATVQRIVARHGGRVWAEARPGEGSTFYFTAGISAERQAA